MKWILIPVLGVLGLLGLLWMYQRSLIYFPTAQLDTPPGDTDFVEVNLGTADGLELGAWHFPPATPDAPTVVVFNGNAGNRSHRVPLATELSERGYGVLLFDYRGYGGNPGSPSEGGLAADARAALDYLDAEGVGLASIVYFGESLGAAVALDLAAEHAPAALILRSPFTSLADVAAAHYPFLPVSLLLRDEYASRDKVGGLQAPLLVVAGSADEIVPTSQSRRLYEIASDPKRLVTIVGASHNDLALLAGDELIEEVDAFITRHVDG